VLFSVKTTGLLERNCNQATSPVTIFCLLCVVPHVERMSFDRWRALPAHLTEHYFKWCTPDSVTDSPSPLISSIRLVLDK